MKRWSLAFVFAALSACGSAELTVNLERDANVQDSIVWYRVIVR